LTGEGFEAVDNILWDLRPWFRPVLIFLVILCQGGFRSSWPTNLAAGPAAILVFCSFFIFFIYSPQFMRDDGSNTSYVIVIGRKLFIVPLFSRLGLSLALFHELLDQFDVVLETVMLRDERIE